MAPGTAEDRQDRIGHLATFSFQSSKNLTAGEGGIITTNDDALAESVPVDPELRARAGRRSGTSTM